MIKNPLKLYNFYIKEKEKAINNKDFTQKTFNKLQKMRKQLQKYGILPINQRWKNL